MSQAETRDLLIVGGGPAGLAAAVYGARAKLKTTVLDKNPGAGALSFAPRIETFPTILTPVPGAEVLGTLRKQAKSFGAEIIQAEAIGVDFTGKPKKVSCLDGEYTGRAVIVATGAMGRKPGIEGEAALIGRGVAYCAACDAAFFEGKDVAMAGELSLALEELDQLAKFARKVYVVSGGIPTEEQKKVLARNPGAELLQGFRIMKISGAESVSSIEIADARNKRDLPVSGVFLYLHGRLPIIDFLQGAVKLNAENCIAVNRDDMSTSVEGVYAVGDVTCKTIRQAVLACADGCIAALSAERYLSSLK